MKKRDKHGRFIRTVPDKICGTCGVNYYNPSKRSKYCGTTCYYKMKKIRGDKVNWTKEMREAYSNRQKGKNNPSWKGGVTVGRVKELNSIRYKRLRESVLKRDKYKCVKCLSGNNLHLDHVVSWQLDKAKRWDKANCRILCEVCHRNKNQKEGKKYWKNQTGESQYWNKI